MLVSINREERVGHKERMADESGAARCDELCAKTQNSFDNCYAFFLCVLRVLRGAILRLSSYVIKGVFNGL